MRKPYFDLGDGKIFNHMSQKGFGNGILVLVVAVLIGTAGYFILTKKSEVEQKSAYPFLKYLPLSATKLEDLRKLFIKRNGSKWLVELDEFGFVKEVTTSDPALVPQVHSDSPRFTDEEKSRWQQFIIKNADFFGITDLKTFYLDRYESVGEGLLAAQQEFNGNFFQPGDRGILLNPYEVPITVAKWVNTVPKLEVFAAISSHFWPKATLPSVPLKVKDTIQNKFVGNSYTYYVTTPPVIFDYVCDPLSDGSGCGTPTTVKIRKENLNIQLVPYLFKHSGILELRLVYTIQLIGLPGSWLKIIDAMTGEELKPGP